ncbi:hypothetical protein A9958_13275 (plasmid) [Staphylococcus simulans]|uniref:ABC transporter ATP-binding protein n=1 Tax=Staphylococcus simulans TaxID=1286 RepID=UPI000D0A5B75|nr:ABC transporter ATP-binding protein [Staphylococcus simulans]AVO03401.1 hypothetical protein BI282_13270 [Staphylococcus simulans]AVO06336.1 hypothetical protein BI283_13110 [Staphylococcus simulans]AWG19949.1 hypothetical protein A9958_13275 [Staphylococcus simulans]AWI02833.1 hypothetical protein A7X73_12810 [Staphylococcus simulans]
MGELALELKNVNKYINNNRIIKDLSLSVEKGEIFGLLGPNGAGKTTTIKMITSLIKMNSGQIKICGTDISKKKLYRIGAVVENPAFYEFLSGKKNIDLYANMFKNNDRKYIKRIIDKVGLTSRINDKVNDYSLGMKQRLGLAIALINKPSILILDEPTNGLDPNGVIAMRKYLKELSHDYNIAILVSSHQLNEMEYICDRVGIMKDGELLITEDLKKYNNMYSNIKYEVETNDDEKSRKILNNYYTYNENGTLYIKINKNEMDDCLVKLLENGINIYNFSKTNTTLEDYFIEIIE